MARKLCKEIHDVCVSTELKVDFGLKNQITRSSGSIMDNIAEGFERDGRREFIQYLSIAKGSCGETRSQLYRLLDNGYIDQQQFQTLINLAGDISKKLSAFIKYLTNSTIAGAKFKDADSSTT